MGKPAPPRPTRPDSRTAAQSSSLLVTTGGFISSHILISPSLSIVTPFVIIPFASLISPTAVTLPETVAWIGAETNLSESPIFCPTATVSPTFTRGVHGTPICCCIEITTFEGMGILSTGISAVFLLWDTLTPPRPRRTAESTPWVFLLINSSPYSL